MEQEYRLVRSKRKTLAIHILPDAQVEVRAPLRMPVSVIEAFVLSKQGWIHAHLTAVRQKLAEREQYSAGEGETVLLLGREYPVRLREGNSVELKNGSFFLPEREAARKAALSAWYRKEAARLLPESAEKLSAFTGLGFQKLSIGGAATRWGSCNGNNEIRLSWRLILLPEKLIRYVVIHELCHTAEHNHSAGFWKKVGGYLPDYAELRQRLRAFEREHQTQIHWL